MSEPSLGYTTTDLIASEFLTYELEARHDDILKSRRCNRADQQFDILVRLGVIRGAPVENLDALLSVKHFVQRFLAAVVQFEAAWRVIRHILESVIEAAEDAETDCWYGARV